MTKKRKPRRSGAPRASGARSGGAPGTGPLRGSDRAAEEPGRADDRRELAETAPADGNGEEPGPRRKARPATRPTGRTAAADRPAPPRTIFGGLCADSPFPRFRETIASAAEVVARAPALVVVPLVVPVLLWLGLIAAGLDHVPQGLADLIAIPPIGSFLDFNLALELTGLNLGGLALAALALTVVRAFVWSILIGLLLECLDGGRPSPVGVLRGILRFPSVLAITILDLAVVFFAQTLGGSLGSFGSLAFFAGLVGGLYFLAFAPIAAVRDRIPAREAIRRSVRASRMPGSRHVSVVLLYFTLAFLPFMVLPGPLIANPSVRQWAFVLVMSLVHVVFMAAFAYRYISVEDEIPEAAPRTARTARAGRPRRRLF